MKRPTEFLRSVMPADPFQLLFLTGIVCLVVAHGLRWWPAEVGLAPSQPADSFRWVVQTFGTLLVYPIIFAGTAGYFVCFWPGNRPVRRILGLVFLPAMAGLGLMFCRVVYLSGPSSSILENARSVAAHRMNWAQAMLWKLPQGFQFSLTGLLLIAIFTSRLAFGIATLPLALPGSHVLQSKDLRFWRRLQLLIWFLVGLVFLPMGLLSFLIIGVPLFHTSRLPSYVQSAWFSGLSPVMEAMIVFGIAVCIMGREGRQSVRSSIRLPALRWPLLALTFPAGIDALIFTGQYLLDRAQWAAHDFGRFAPPQFVL